MVGALVGMVSLIGPSAGWAQGTWQAPSQSNGEGTWQAPSQGGTQGTGQGGARGSSQGSYQGSYQGTGQSSSQGSGQTSDSGLMYGVYRENNTNIPVGQRNCWAQAMVSGSTINGELLAERLTEKAAETTLQQYAHRGRCSSDVVAPKWTMRGD